MQCSNCGHDSSAGSRYCARCGTALVDATATEPGPEPPAVAPEAPAQPNPWAAPKPWAAPAPAPGPPPAGTYGAPPPAGPYSPPPPYAPPPASASPNPYAPPNVPAPNPYAPPGYGQYPPGVYPHYGGTNGLATASLILGLVGWIPCGIGSIVGIVLGFVALGQIRAAGGAQSGDGVAKAGIILGFVGIALVIGYFVVAAATTSSSS
jgi:hypothetical protein